MGTFLRAARGAAGAILVLAILPGLRAADGLGASRATIRVDSNLVLIPVTVTDRANRSVTGLERDTFRVFDGKYEQRLTHFSREDAPLSAGIVFDASGSMRDKLAKSREAVAAFLGTANPEDEFFLVECSDRARVAVPFSAPEEVQNHLLTAEARGRTPLLDAVYLALQYIKKAHNARRALLVISDGIENDSRFTASELRNAVREADVWIYSIGIYQSTVMLPEEQAAGQGLLASLAAETGGREVALRNTRDLPEMARAIGIELRNQYVLGFTPDNSVRDGKYHRVQIKLVEGKKLRVSAKPGYFAPQ